MRRLSEDLSNLRNIFDQKRIFLYTFYLLKVPEVFKKTTPVGRSLVHTVVPGLSRVGRAGPEQADPGRAQHPVAAHGRGGHSCHGCILTESI
jgi:hypothetical protein